MVEYIVAIDVTRVRFPADATLLISVLKNVVAHFEQKPLLVTISVVLSIFLEASVAQWKSVRQSCKLKLRSIPGGCSL